MRARTNRVAGNTIICSDAAAVDRRATVERLVVSKYKAAARSGALRRVGGEIAIAEGRWARGEYVRNGSRG